MCRVHGPGLERDPARVQDEGTADPIQWSAATVQYQLGREWWLAEGSSEYTEAMDSSITVRYDSSPLSPLFYQDSRRLDHVVRVRSP